jgi:hypothetical protein
MVVPKREIRVGSISDSAGLRVFIRSSHQPMKEEGTTKDIEREEEFIRSPVLDHQVFCLQSWCGHCGFTILASSVYDLVEEEERHIWNCAARRESISSCDAA